MGPSAFAHQGDLADRRTLPRTTANPAPLPIKGPGRLSMLGYCSPERGGPSPERPPTQHRYQLRAPRGFRCWAIARPREGGAAHERPPAPLPIKGPERLSMLEQSLAVGLYLVSARRRRTIPGLAKGHPQSRAKKAPYTP